jgi:hypothetical protein
MTALLDNAAADNSRADCAPAEFYVVSHGKSGGLGSFNTREPLLLRRGHRVLVDGPRGREIGTVLCPANVRQSRSLGAVASGTIVRPVTAADDATLKRLRVQEQQLFEAARRLARAHALPIEILDVDLLWSNAAVLQFVGPEEAPLEAFVRALSRDCQCDVRLENLALPEEPAEPASQGCGKPDCGKAGGGSCSTCSSGGGCSSCGSTKTDLRPYFAHLRAQMEAGKRTPLL